MNAQTWTAPTLSGSTLTTSTQYYVYNVGANGFLARGGQWSAEAVVAKAGYKMTANSSASLWQLYYEDNTRTLFAADVNGGWVYTDGAANNAWDIQLYNAGNNIYTIQIANTYGGYNASQYLGTSATVYAANNGVCNDVRYNTAGGDSYTQWKFVSQANLDLYQAKVLLDRYMTLGKNKGMNISSYITTYNAGVTADINTAAANLLTALNRTDVSSSILNPSFEDSFTSWTNNGGFAIQTNAPGQGWTKAGTNYVEKYTGSGWNAGNSLIAGSITQTVSSLSNGLYELVVSGHAVQQAGGNPLHTGAFITAGTQSTEVGAGQDYTVSNIPVTNGTLTIGYALSGTIGCNWTGFDNFRLYYYGASVTTAINTANNLSKPSIYIKGNAIVTDFELAQSSIVEISVFNAQGILISKEKAICNAGSNQRTLSANSASGVYLVRMSVDGKSVTQKIVK